MCDPMHGNTESTSNGYKTRRFDNIRGEVEQSFDLHAAAGTRPVSYTHLDVYKRQKLENWPPAGVSQHGMLG